MPSTVSTGKSFTLGELMPSVEAPESGAAASPVRLPADVEARVTDAVADVWGVPSDLLVLHWNGWDEDRDVADAVDLRLVGPGTDGWFAVLFEFEDRPAFAARLRCGVSVPIATAARVLSAGETLESADIALAEDICWGPPDEAVEQPQAGWLVKHDIAAGETLSEPATCPPPVIMKGGLVRLTWRRRGVTVSVSGIALNDAAVGRRVSVRLRGRRGNAWGTVVGPGVASLHS